MSNLFWNLWICLKGGSPELHPQRQGAPRLLMRETLSLPLETLTK